MITRDFLIIAIFKNSEYILEYASHIVNVVIKDMEDTEGKVS